MRDVLEHFVRDADGSWICVVATELHLPSGRIQVTVGSRFVRGLRFMGVDLAAVLEARQREGSRR